MPIYTYRCRKCLKVFEVFKYPSEYKAEICPECYSEDVAKLLNSVPVHYKGKGFYSTDYGRKK